MRRTASVAIAVPVASTSAPALRPFRPLGRILAAVRMGLALRPNRRHEAHDAVRDGEHPARLLEGVGRRVEADDVVPGLALVVDLVGQLALAPRRDLVPTASATLDRRLDALDDLALPVLLEVRVDHEHDLVFLQPDHLLRSVRPRRL